MKLKADVRLVTGRTKHHVGRIVAGKPVKDAEVPPPFWLQIDESDGGFLLLRMDETGAAIADTWHETMKEAKEQAAFEFEVAEEDWVVVDN